MRKRAAICSVFVAWVSLAPATASAQAMPAIGFRSAGRGWPVEPALPSTGKDPAALADFNPALAVGPLRVQIHAAGGGVSRTVEVGSAWDGKTPEGVKPLAV